MAETILLLVVTGVVILWYAFDWMFCFGTGIRKLYQTYPHADSDPTQRHIFTWRASLNVLLNRPMVRFGLGERYLHVSFFLLPVLFHRPISIPWEEVILESPLEESLLPVFRRAEFRLGSDWFFIRLRGRSARAIQAKVIALRGALTSRSTRTPPVLPSVLFLLFAFSASLSASVQAGPVSFIR